MVQLKAEYFNSYSANSHQKSEKIDSQIRKIAGIKINDTNFHIVKQKTLNWNLINIIVLFDKYKLLNSLLQEYS